jgi:hypothetical protein
MRRREPRPRRTSVRACSRCAKKRPIHWLVCCADELACVIAGTLSRSRTGSERARAGRRPAVRIRIESPIVDAFVFKMIEPCLEQYCELKAMRMIIEDWFRRRDRGLSIRSPHGKANDYDLAGPLFHVSGSRILPRRRISGSMRKPKPAPISPDRHADYAIDKC